MAENQQSTQEPSPQPNGSDVVKPDSTQPGGVSVGDDNQTTVGGDISGRDKNVAGGHIIHAEPGSTVIVGTDSVTPLPAKTPARHIPKLTRRIAALISAAGGILIIIIIIDLINPLLPTPPPLPSPVSLLTQPSTNCPGDLTTNFSAELQGTLSANKIPATVQAGDSTSNASDKTSTIILRLECAGDRVTYSLELPHSESEIAELESFTLSWSLDFTEPEKIIAAVVAYYNGEVEKAAAWLSETAPKWAQLTPLERANLAFLLGNAWLRHQIPSTDLALAQYESALSDLQSIGNNQPRLIARLYNNRGRAYLKDSNFEAAEEELDLAVKADPSYVWALLNRSTVYMNRDRFEEAVADCTQAIRQVGNFAPGYVCKAQVYYRQESFAEALIAAKAAIDIDPQYGPAYYFAGVSSCRQGEAHTAAEFFQKSKLYLRDPELTSRADEWLELIESGSECE